MLLTVAVLTAMMICLPACSNGNNNQQNGEGEGENVDRSVRVQLFVRDAFCKNISEGKLFYDGNEVGNLSAGVFCADINVGNAEFDAKKLSTGVENATYIVQSRNDSLCSFEGGENYPVVLIVVKQGDAPNGFTDIGGKVVLHSDGETRLNNASILINGTKVLTCANGNYNINYVPVGANLSAELDGYGFVDIAANPEDYQTVSDVKTVYTFRAVAE